MDIGKRLSVEGPDEDGDYELTLRDVGDTSDGNDYTYLNRAEADALIMALARPDTVRDALALMGIVRGVVDEQGRWLAPPQPTTPARPSGPWDGNGKVEP